MAPKIVNFALKKELLISNEMAPWFMIRICVKRKRLDTPRYHIIIRATRYLRLSDEALANQGHITSSIDITTCCSP